jgi:hypothetical protein
MYGVDCNIAVVERRNESGKTAHKRDSDVLLFSFGNGQKVN